jgi:ribosomal protein S3
MLSKAKNSVAHTNNAKNPYAKEPENLHRRAIREYLEKTLGDQKLVEFKISKMQQDLGITMQTLYKHLRVLREKEYDIKPLQYSSLLKRKSA